MRTALRTAAAVAMAVAGHAGMAFAAGPALYETGPAQDAAFVRFVNATGQKLDVVSGQARLPLERSAPVSDYLSVRPNTEIKGRFEAGSLAGAVAVKTTPGTFATVVVFPAPDQKALSTQVVNETPDDFNALKASIAFYNLDADCKPAGLQTAGKAVSVFTGVAAGAMQRRAVNAVPQLSVQLTCAGQVRGTPTELGALQTGQRYSVLVLPALPGAAPRLLAATDNLAR